MSFLRSASPRAAGFGLLLLLAVQPAFAQPLAAAKAKGLLSVEYSYESTGTDKKDGGTTTWRAKRTATLSAEVFALPPNDIPVLHDQTAALAQAQGKFDQAAGIADSLSPSLAGVQAIMERCGDDEACIERESMKLGEQMQANGQMKTLNDARGQVGQLAKAGSRYQYWGGNFGTGSFAIDEVIEITAPDGEGGGYTTNKTVRQGGGALPTTVAGVKIPTGGPGNLTGIEYDSGGATLALKLPVPGLTPGTETQTLDTRRTPKPQAAKEVMLAFPAKAPGDDKPLIVKIKGGWKSQSGQEVIQLKGSQQEGGKLTIRWRFKAG